MRKRAIKIWKKVEKLKGVKKGGVKREKKEILSGEGKMFESPKV